MEKIKRVKLKSGVEVFFLTCEKYTTSTVQFMFPIGWRHDDEKYLGLAHFFEHLVGKRTKNYPGKTELTRFLEKEGIVGNAYTSSDLTCYHHSNSHNRLIFSLEKLLEAIYFSEFVEEDLNMEKEVVMTEARQYLDDDDSLLWHKLMGKMFPGTSIDKFLFGTPETMKNIDVAKFKEFYKMYLNPKNTKIFIGTNNLKNEKKIVKLLNDFYAKNKKILSTEKINKLEEKSTVTTSEPLIINKNDKTQANIRLAWTVPPLNKKERIDFVVLRRILTAGFSARLMKKLRDELGLVYGISLGRNMFVGGLGYMMFATACKKEEKEKVFQIILEEVEKLKNDLTQEEINNVVPMLEYYHERQSNVENDVSDLIDAYIYRDEYLTSPEFLKLVKSVKVKDVKKLIEKLFKKENEFRGVLE
jgi:predicted Zn-dependent peptidase